MNIAKKKISQSLWDRIKIMHDDGYKPSEIKYLLEPYEKVSRGTIQNVLRNKERGMPRIMPSKYPDNIWNFIDKKQERDPHTNSKQMQQAIFDKFSKYFNRKSTVHINNKKRLSTK